MNPAAISKVALFDVPREPMPFRVGLATSESLVAISAEFSNLAAAATRARRISDALRLPIVARLRLDVLRSEGAA